MRCYFSCWCFVTFHFLPTKIRNLMKKIPLSFASLTRFRSEKLKNTQDKVQKNQIEGADSTFFGICQLLWSEFCQRNRWQQISWRIQNEFRSHLVDLIGILQFVTPFCVNFGCCYFSFWCFVTFHFLPTKIRNLMKMRIPLSSASLTIFWSEKWKSAHDKVQKN